MFQARPEWQTTTSVMNLETLKRREANLMGCCAVVVVVVIVAALGKIKVARKLKSIIIKALACLFRIHFHHY